MLPVNVAKALLFLVVLLIALATSKPFSRSHGITSRRSGFEWNTRKVGSRRVATISIRKDEERDRRSVAIADGASRDIVVPSGKSSSRSPPSSLQHHHHDHTIQDAETPVRYEEDKRHHLTQYHPSQHSPSQHHYHRHHHGEKIHEGIASETDKEGSWPSGSGLKQEPSEESRSERLKNHGPHFKEAHLSELSRHSSSSNEKTSLQEILTSIGFDIDEELFKNITSTIQRHKRKKTGKKVGKKKKRSKKVKRDRRRKKGRKGRNKDGRKRNRFRKCKRLKGKQKKKCRADIQAAETAAAAAAAEAAATTTTSKPSIETRMSGSEACQYHNLEECSRKVGFLRRDPDDLRTVVKCRFREEFFDCMEEQRMEMCDPSFETQGDMKSLRKSIRDAIHTTDSCIISEVLEG